MLSNEEYRALKEKEMRYAEGVVAGIQADTSPFVYYKESRPITDLKQFLESSVKLYGSNVAFYQKEKRGGEYKTVTYDQAYEDINALGTVLTDMGLQGKRIAVIGENCYKWAVSYFAVICGVGTVVPLDKELNESELEQLCEKGKVEAVIFTDRFEKTFENIKERSGGRISCLINMGLPESPRRGGTKEEKEGICSWNGLVERGTDLMASGDRRFLDAQISRDEMSVLLFTSGTTGVSKGVMLSHGNLVEDVMASPTVLKVNSWDIFFSVLPIHHTYEFTSGHLIPLYKGAAIAYCEGLKQITKNLEEVKPTMFLGVPVLFETLYKKIWKNVQKMGKEDTLKKAIKINNKLKKIGIDLSKKLFKDIHKVFGGRMRLMIVGGAAINPEILDGIRDFGINALQGYGLTECSPMAALNPDQAPKPSSIGVCFPGFEMKIQDANEEGIGEICVKGGHVMLGYYEMPEETRKVIDEDGWFHTGDLGYCDSEGYFYITGRQKNVIITKNGKNVYPEELEYYINNISFVQESMVFDDTGEKGDDTIICAAVKLDSEEVAEMFPGASDEEVEKRLNEEIDKINKEQPLFKNIRKVIVKENEFEKNTSKKIKRFAAANKEK